MDAQNASKSTGNVPYRAYAEIWLRRDGSAPPNTLWGDFLATDEIGPLIAEMLAQDLPERDKLAKAYEAGRNTPA